jgi:hypothetical protein
VAKGRKSLGASGLFFGAEVAGFWLVRRFSSRYDGPNLDFREAETK